MEKIGILTAFLENYKSLEDIVIPNWQQYCNKYGYLLLKHVGEYGGGPLGFQKLRYLYDSMFVKNEIDLALVLDLDILITNFTIRIEDWINSDKSYFVSKDVNGFNNGSFIFQKTAQSKELLEFILSFANSYSNEQDVLKDLYESNELLNKNVCVLPQPSINSLNYNHYPEYKQHTATDLGQWQKGHYLLHLPGMRLEQRINIFKDLLGKDNIIYE